MTIQIGLLTGRGGREQRALTTQAGHPGLWDLSRGLLQPGHIRNHCPWHIPEVLQLVQGTLCVCGVCLLHFWGVRDDREWKGRTGLPQWDFLRDR